MQKQTYSICDREYPIVRQAKIIDNKRNCIGTIPIVDIPQVSDYQWQLDCLNDRLLHPEKYEWFENVNETIERLWKWLKEHTEQE